LQAEGAKKKLSKRNAEKRVSPSAKGEEASAASTAPPFEKGGRKRFAVWTVLIPLSAS